MAYRPYDSGEMTGGEPASELASPWVRLVAYLIDSLIYIVVLMVVMIIGIMMVGIGIPDLGDSDPFRIFIGAYFVVIALAF